MSRILTNNSTTVEEKARPGPCQEHSKTPQNNDHLGRNEAQPRPDQRRSTNHPAVYD